jgi:hypothetical protein
MGGLGGSAALEGVQEGEEVTIPYLGPAGPARDFDGCPILHLHFL